MLTYQSLCKKIIPFFHNQIEDETDYEIYLYALEGFLSTLVNFLVIILVGIFFHIMDYVIFYLLFFIPFRCYEGGLHAKTHFRCIVLFLLLMLISFISTIFFCTKHFEIYIGTFSLLFRNILTFYRILRAEHSSYKTKKRRQRFCYLTIFATTCYIVIYQFSPLYGTIGAISLLMHMITSLTFFTVKTEV